MSKVRSGLTLFGVGLGLSIALAALGFVPLGTENWPRLLDRSVMALWVLGTFASFVLTLFGLVRLVWGLLTRGGPMRPKAKPGE